MPVPDVVEAAGVSERYDALVIGGGPAGATAALLLVRAGWSVAVVERKAFPRRKVCGEYLSATNLPLLDRLGVGDAFRELAGPPVRRVGLFAGRAVLRAELPRAPGSHGEWGRALSRERLDTLLLDAAARAGAHVRQPCVVRSVRREGETYALELEDIGARQPETLVGRVVIAAHGSWDAGALPTQPPRVPAAPSDLLAFKAHFTNADLPEGLMPLLAFPGGYGGMVRCDDGRVTLSCCVRRDMLTGLRNSHDEAGHVVLAHIMDSCDGVRHALARARREELWLAAGPIRPGIRLAHPAGVFAVGNAAGEAHPAIAEGISMAMQSSWLLARRLSEWRRAGGGPDGLRAAGHDYAADWRRHFAPRVYASEVIAHWAMRPAAVAGMLPILHFVPATLAWGARLSGKASVVVH